MVANSETVQGVTDRIGHGYGFQRRLSHHGQEFHGERLVGL